MISPGNLILWLKTCGQKRGITSTNFKQNSSSNYRRQHQQRRHSSTQSRDSMPPPPSPLSDYKIPRRWIQPKKYQNTKTTPTTTTTISQSFSVLSYNILAKGLLSSHSYLYTKCDQNVLDWSYRWNNLAKEIKSYNSDVICLQEVEDVDLVNDIQPLLENMGYQTNYKKRMGRNDGLLTAVRTSSFQIISVTPVDYYRPGDDLTDRENVGLICLVETKLTGDERAAIVICNTHLLYNPKRGDKKLVQICTFLAEIDRVVNGYYNKHQIQPAVILCGDFNSTPFSPLFHFVTYAQLFYRDLPRQAVSGQDTGNCRPNYLPVPLLPHNLRINQNCTYLQNLNNNNETNQQQQQREEEYHQHSAGHITHNIGKLTSTNHIHENWEATTTQDRGITVDYIFYSSQQQSPSHEPRCQLFLQSHLSLPMSQQIRCVGSIPNRVHSSDHLPVAAVFSVQAPSQALSTTKR